MTQYDATTTCRNLNCTVVTYAYDQRDISEAPECPACSLRRLVASLTATPPPTGWRNRGENT